ncbi:MAG: serine/threonine-protein kinase [Myxococcota bacterium]
MTETHEPPAVRSRTQTLGDEDAAVGARWERGRGTTIGRYRIEERLGAGAMGVVYGAVDPTLDRSVAIKMAHASDTGSRRGADRFAREARAMAALDHPHVVKVYDFGLRDDEAYLVMERLRARTLTDWLETSPSRRERLRVMREAGEGLAAAHAAGLVHRDFKPDNVLITDRLEAKVTDFGLARAYGDDDSSSDAELSGPSGVSGAVSHTVTAQGVAVGTPAFMSPEQHRALPLTPRSDQYSYCVTLYEALTGNRLFRAPTVLALEELKDQGPPLEAFRGLPLYLARALRRGLQPRAADRFADMATLLRALDRSRALLWGGAAVLVAVPVGLAAMPASPRTEDCGAPSLLDAEQRRGIEAALLEGTEGVRGDRIERVLAMLDGEALAWSDAYEQTCELEPIARDLAQSCLLRHRGTFDALVERLGRRASDADAALSQVTKLTEADACLQPLASRLEQARQDPTVRAYLDEVARRRRAAKDAMRVGDALAARAELTLALDAIARVEPEALRTHSLTMVGNELDSVGEYKLAHTVLRQAYDIARSVDDDRRAAGAAVHLSWVEGMSLGEIEAGRRWGREAELRMQNFTPKPDLAAARLMNMAALSQAEGDLDEALAFMRQADEVGRTDVGEETPARQSTRLMARSGRQHNIGAILYWQGNHAEALAAFQDAVVSVQAARGTDHPDANDSLQGVCRTAEALGDLDLAHVSARTMVRNIETHRGPDHPSIVNALSMLAAVEYARGDMKSVKQRFLRAIEIYDQPRYRGQYQGERASTQTELAGVLRELGELDEGAAVAMDAYERLEDESDPSLSVHRTGALRELALIEADRGRYELAIDYLFRMDEAGRNSAFARNNGVVMAITHVYVFTEAGRFDEAIEASEKGMIAAERVPDSVDAHLLRLRTAEAFIGRDEPGDRESARALIERLQANADAFGVGEVDEVVALFDALPPVSSR